jgi:hypothetical protein
MKTMRKYWYLVVLLLAGLIVNENIVQWALAVQVGDMSVGAGFKDAFEYFSISGYLFFTAFRLIPYVGLGSALLILSRTKFKDYSFPVFYGGLVGILAFIVWGSWMVQRPFYTEDHVSSTTAISFLFIPIYAVPAGVVGGILLSAIYMPFRIIKKRRKTEQDVDGNTH